MIPAESKNDLQSAHEPAGFARLDAAFVAIKQSVMNGSQCVATARSSTLAKRIANALNAYQASRKGV
jgi:hypothetical protein